MECQKERIIKPTNGSKILGKIKIPAVIQCVYRSNPRCQTMIPYYELDVLGKCDSKKTIFPQEIGNQNMNYIKTIEIELFPGENEIVLSRRKYIIGPDKSPDPGDNCPTELDKVRVTVCLPKDEKPKHQEEIVVEEHDECKNDRHPIETICHNDMPLVISVVIIAIILLIIVIAKSRNRMM